MFTPWEDALNQYRAQNFRVLSREMLLTASHDEIFNGIQLPLPVLIFLQQFTSPQNSVWSAFFTSVRSVHSEMQEQDVFVPFKQLFDQVIHVAILYGEHIRWKSHERWSYLFQTNAKDPSDPDLSDYFIAHLPATQEHIQQAEAILGMQLSPQYKQFLMLTNGVGIALEELEYVFGIGSARAPWDDVLAFQKSPVYPVSLYHEITMYWLQWQNVLAYERQRDRETGINTFVSDERICVPFAYTFDDWCFDRSQQNKAGEYPVLFWDHESREATKEYPDFASWFLDTITNDYEHN